LFRHSHRLKPTDWFGDAGGDLTHGISNERRIDELFEANDQATSDDEMVGDAYVEGLVRRLVACRVPG
jgi:hypothetical protein